MRASTGNSDVKQMVTKFLTRETTYAELLKAISVNEKRHDQLKLENQEKREKLLQLKIDNDNQKKLE